MFDNVIETYKDILTAVKQHAPSAVLAGGCLRDTFYGVEVKDLDFVLQTTGDDVELGISPRSEWLTEVWPDKEFRWVPLVGDAYEEIEIDAQGNGLLDVIESTDGTINLIVVRDIPLYTKHFPDSISKMVFDGEAVHVANEWTDGDINKRIYYRTNIKPNRLEKLERKYPAPWVFVPDGVAVPEPQLQQVVPIQQQFNWQVFRNPNNPLVWDFVEVNEG